MAGLAQAQEPLPPAAPAAPQAAAPSGDNVSSLQAQIGERGALGGGGGFGLDYDILITHGLFSPGGDADDLARRSPIFFMRSRI